MNLLKKDIIFNDVNKLKGVGKQLSKYLKNKKIEKVKDILLNLPYSETDRSKITSLDKLEIGKIQTIRVIVKKLNFPRVRNLPNKISCENESGKIEIVYFNSREGYLRKIYPVDKWVVISGKIGFFNKKYQMTNPDYVTTIDKEEYVKQVIPKYSLTKGINEKKYRLISDQVINNLPDIQEWYENDFLKKNNFLNWKENIITLHKTKDGQNKLSSSYKRLVFDEIFSNLLVLSKNRKKIKKKKKNKNFKSIIANKILKRLPFELTKSQKNVLEEINFDLKSNTRMFRIIQGDVGSGKTIIALIAALNVIKSGFQVALMVPTEILAKQHYNLATDLFGKHISIELLTGKTEYRLKKNTLENIKQSKIKLIIGTHALFQKKVDYKNLGLIIIDEQHKFGVKQRKELSDKGGNNCDVLVMSATPIPRTMIMTIYGDMDVTLIKENPKIGKQ